MTTPLVTMMQAYQYAMKCGRVFSLEDLLSDAMPAKLQQGDDGARRIVAAWREAASEALDQAHDAGWIVQRLEPTGETRYLVAAPGGQAALASRRLQAAVEDCTRAMLRVEQALKWHGEIVRAHMPALRSEGGRR